MFRAKIVATVVLAFATAGTLVYLNLAETGRQQAQDALTQRLTVAEKAVLKSRQLSAYATLAKARQVARWPQIARVLAKPPESFAGEDGVVPSAADVRYEIHRLMNEEVLVWNARFNALASGKLEPTADLHDLRRARPDVFAVVDTKGIGVAKGNDAGWYGSKAANLGAAHPVLLTAAQKGQAFLDVWLLKGAPTLVGVAPVKLGEQVVGAVVLGYQLTDSEAKADKALTGMDVAYFLGARVGKSSSLSPKAEKEVAQAVATQQLFAKSGAQQLTIGGAAHLARVGRVGGFASAKDVGYVVLGNLDNTLAQAESPLSIVLLACGLACLLCIGLVLLFIQQFIKPFERIDQGVMELISGNADSWFDGQGKTLAGTMSQNLNILVCILTGRPLPDDPDGSALAEAMQRIERGSTEVRPMQPPGGG